MMKYKVACGASTSDLERSMNALARQGYTCSFAWTDNRHRCHYVVMERDDETIEEEKWPLG